MIEQGRGVASGGSVVGCCTAPQLVEFCPSPATQPGCIDDFAKLIPEKRHLAIPLEYQVAGPLAIDALI